MKSNKNEARIENEYGYWADSCYHYRITDYQGNVRAVIGAGGALEEVNGYYPYGGITGAPATGVKRADIFGRATPLLIICRPDGANERCSSSRNALEWHLLLPTIRGYRHIMVGFDGDSLGAHRPNSRLMLLAPSNFVCCKVNLCEVQAWSSML